MKVTNSKDSFIKEQNL